MHPGGKREAFGGTEMAQCLLVAEREIHRLHRALEKRQQAIGLVDQPATGELQQIANLQVEAAQRNGGPGVAKTLDKGGGVDQIGQQHSTQHRRDRTARGCPVW